MNYNKKVNPFYTSSKWLKIRKAYILEYPLCEVCSSKGLTVATAEIDHKIAIKIDESLSLEWDNLQGLCRRCHAKKTKAVDERVLKGLPVKPWKGANADGIPLDNELWK